MAIRERLNENTTRDVDEDLDDLDLAYVEQLRSSGIDEALIQQFIEMNKKEKN